MKAAVVEAVGREPAYADFPEPVAREREVLVSVTASALSPLARGRASGTHYSSSGAYPFVAGVDGVGRLVDGRRVYFLLPRTPFGAMAERTVVADGQWITIPDEVDDATAAVIANPGMSSWAALTHRARIRPGETVLVNGATGAAGTLAVRIARHLGAGRVIATGRNRAVLDTLGADATIPLDEDATAMGEAFEAVFVGGVDVVLDYLWGPSARSILVAAAKSAPDGVPIRFVQIGSAGGAEIPMPAAVLRSTSIEMLGSGLGSVGIDQLLASIDGVLRSAVSADLTLEHRLVPLAAIGAAWSRSGERIVFTTDAMAASNGVHTAGDTLG